MKKLISLFLVVIMIMSMSTVAFAVDFDDVADTHSNYEAIETLETLGIINGYEDGSYGSDKVLTRAECATMLTRAMYPVYYGNSETFTDVPVTHWARIYVDTAYRHGLMVGHGDGTFGPDDELTYTQFARVILNTLGYGIFEWPVGVNTVAYELGLYHNIPVVDFETGCTRAHAAQMLYNAFDMAIVRQYANHHFVTDKNFLNDVLGYEVTNEYVNGHIYTAYKQTSTNKVLVTDLCETYEATIYPTTDGEGYRLSRRGQVIDVNWYWATDAQRPPVYLYINGVEITNGSETKFAACDSATGIFDSNDNLVAIYVVNPGTSYTPLNLITEAAGIPEIVKFDIVHDPDFNLMTSTVTYFEESASYIISNTVIYGFATNAGFNFLEVDGVRYEVARIPYEYAKGAFVVLYVDYKGAVADYTFDMDPYVYNVNTGSYHTFECTLYQNRFLENWMTDEEIAANLTSDDGVLVFIGCSLCHTKGTFRAVNVPTGYVTVEGWDYYHTYDCEYIKDTTKTLIPIANIYNTDKARHECCDNH